MPDASVLSMLTLAFSFFSRVVLAPIVSGIGSAAHASKPGIASRHSAINSPKAIKIRRTVRSSHRGSVEVWLIFQDLDIIRSFLVPGSVLGAGRTVANQ